ncbi:MULTISPECIES: RNA polymerase sigma factor [unclassified Plantibacter]|uniref:RNA polymerase sigma factor n=1 Tax=unclassified Plantibacter TaxID=2624265 RepID=UPI003D327DF6
MADDDWRGGRKMADVTQRVGPSPLDRASDRTLVERCIDGDTRAFETLITRYGRMMKAYAVRLTGSPADADDVVQESLISAWKRIDTLADGDLVKSWLMRIVSRRAIDLMRQRRDADSTDDVMIESPERDGPERRAEASSQLDALSASLDRLPEGQRQSWVLREIGGYSYEEIAEQLGQTTASVRGNLARARATLVREMEGWR